MSTEKEDHAGDGEFAALETAYRALRSQPRDVQVRMIVYLDERLAKEAKAQPTLENAFRV